MQPCIVELHPVILESSQCYHHVSLHSKLIMMIGSINKHRFSWSLLFKPEKAGCRNKSSVRQRFVSWLFLLGFKSYSQTRSSVPVANKLHCKLKRSVSAPKCQFSPAGHSLIQPFLEPFEHNLGQKSSIKRLFQPTVGPISALGPISPS